MRRDSLRLYFSALTASSMKSSQASSSDETKRSSAKAMATPPRVEDVVGLERLADVAAEAAEVGHHEDVEGALRGGRHHGRELGPRLGALPAGVVVGEDDVRVDEVVARHEALDLGVLLGGAVLRALLLGGLAPVARRA